MILRQHLNNFQKIGIIALVALLLLTGCKTMQNKETEEISLIESTVGRINGLTIGTGGVYTDEEDGRQKVNLTINRVPNPELEIGNIVKIGDQNWEVAEFKNRPGKQKGLIVMRRKLP